MWIPMLAVLSAVLVGVAQASGADAALPPLLEGAALHSYITAFTEEERGEPFWGVDSSETRYASAGELWAAKAAAAAQIGPSARSLYALRNATVKGMTELDEEGSARDLAHTASLVRRVLQSRGGDSSSSSARCLSMCAGIGREAVGALLPAGCTTIDLLEPQQRLLEVALAALPPAALGRAYATTAQEHDFAASGAAYDVVFFGWCSMHFSDEDLLAVLRGATSQLVNGGALVWKDNVSDYADLVLNDVDHFAFRGASYTAALVGLAQPGMERLAVEGVPGWPGNLFPYRAALWTRGGEWDADRRDSFAAASPPSDPEEGEEEL